MAWEIGTTDQAGTTGFAHKEFLLRVQALATANGWVTLRYKTDDPASHELILKGSGLSGTEEIFVGFRTYENVTADYYNLLAGTFIGYQAANSFDTQPGARLSGVPMHNQLIEYYLSLDASCIVLCGKVGVGVYESGYVGKMLPYATPGEFPAPLVNGGMLTDAAATRFSDTTHSMGFKGSKANFALRNQAGAWVQPACHPWGNTLLAGTGAALNNSSARDTAGTYVLQRVTLTDTSPNVYGCLNRVFQVSGFNLVADTVLQLGGTYTVDDTGKTTLQIVNEIIGTAGGRAFVVLRDTYRTAFGDYFALEML